MTWRLSHHRRSTSLQFWPPVLISTTGLEMCCSRRGSTRTPAVESPRRGLLATASSAGQGRPWPSWLLSVANRRPAPFSPLSSAAAARAWALECDIPTQGLIGLIRILIPTSCNFFSRIPSLKTPKLSVIGLERWVTDREVLPGCA
jgi:hypothetical protein